MRRRHSARTAGIAASVAGCVVLGCGPGTPHPYELKAGCRLERAESAMCRVYNHSRYPARVEVHVSADPAMVAGDLAGESSPTVPGHGFVDVRVPLAVRIAVGQFSNPGPGEVEAYTAEQWANARRTPRIVGTVRLARDGEQDP